MNQTNTKSLLAELDVIPSKKLGQNFLVDENVSRWIVEQLDVQPEDTIVEVGPGLGALTEHVVKLASHVILIEYDARLADGLRKKFQGESHVTVIHEDGARYDVRQLFQHQPIKFLGNLPYSAGGAIMRNLMKRPSPVAKAVLMLQKEFIDRIIAKPRTKEYGVLSLRMQSEWDSKPVKTIPPQAFHPRPLIDSTVMVCEPRKELLPVYDARLFDELVRRGFAQRRKQMRKQMPDTADWEAVTEEIGISETARAEELSLEQWVNLTICFDDHPLKNVPQSGDEIFDVVDENDHVIGKATRSEVHEKKMIHRAVHVLVFNKHKEVFLQKRSRLKDVHPGDWDSSAAGHLDAGESYESAAIRELEEELGISQAEVQEVVHLQPCDENGWEHVKLFLCRYDGSVRFPCSEVEAGEWFGIETIDTWLDRRPEDFAGGFRMCWAAFKKGLGKLQKVILF